MSDSTFDPAALAKLQAKTNALRLGGKGTPRRKIVAKSSNSQKVDAKLAAALKKLEVQTINGVEEVNMFRENGPVLHFSAPKVHGATGSNTFAIYGQGVDKDLTELVPGVLNQLGPDAMANLKRLAESFQSSQGAAGAAVPEGVEAAGEDEAGDDEVPELVEAEATAEPTGGKIEEIN